MDEVFEKPLTLWWPGISGVEPQYFTKNELKGLGWEEFPVYNIKAELRKKFNVNIIDWIVSPSRLDYEFEANRRPICIFPYRWSNPAKEFAQPRKQLISYAVDYDDNRNLGILIRKDDAHRFNDLYKDNGDLDLAKLIDRKDLSTAIVKGVEYHPVVQTAIEILNEGDWKIKENYIKNIHLMVASNNNQLLKMLENKRIDYIFDQLINTKHFEQAKVVKSDFKTIIYKKELASSVKDPRLTRLSVRCNLHPDSFVFLPTINNLLSPEFIHAMDKNVWDRHRSKIDKGFQYQSRSFQQRLTGKQDTWWYQEFKQDKNLGQALEATVQKATPKS